MIYLKTREEHVKHVDMVLRRLQQHGLKLNRKECHFGCEEVTLLGYIMSAVGIRTHPGKTKAIANMAPPTSVKEVRSFLGRTGYYQTTIPNYMLR